jgi:hypothetical protein
MNNGNVSSFVRLCHPGWIGRVGPLMRILLSGFHASLRMSRFAAVPLIMLLAAAPATAQPGLVGVDPDRAALLIETIRANGCAMTEDEVEPILVGLDYDAAEAQAIVAVLLEADAVGFDEDWNIFLSEDLCAADPAQDAAFFAAAADPQRRYVILESQRDVARDAVTGLEWQRCSLGQDWDGQTCTGEAAHYTWEEAGQAADAVADWRLPTIDELRTLVYCSSSGPHERFPGNGGSCDDGHQQPTIVVEVFPNTPADWYWSGSPSVWRPFDSAWSVTFDSGGNTEYAGQSSTGRVRLVRGAQ